MASSTTVSTSRTRKPEPTNQQRRVLCSDLPALSQMALALSPLSPRANQPLILFPIWHIWVVCSVLSGRYGLDPSLRSYKERQTQHGAGNLLTQSFLCVFIVLVPNSCGVVFASLFCAFVTAHDATTKGLTSRTPSSSRFPLEALHHGLLRHQRRASPSTIRPPTCSHHVGRRQ